MDQTLPKISESEASQRLQAAKQKAQRINDRIVAYSATKEQLQRQLAEYEREALERFGTSNLEEMRKIYRQQVETQTRETLRFESEIESNMALIQQIDAEIAKIEEKYAR